MVSESFVRSTPLSRVTAGAEARWDLRAWKPATPMRAGAGNGF